VRSNIHTSRFPTVDVLVNKCPANHSAEDIADVDCCGCLIVRVPGGEADILCNECAVVIRTVPVGDVEALCWT
jgi:hypothetical protein